MGFGDQPIPNRNPEDIRLKEGKNKGAYPTRQIDFQFQSIKSIQQKILAFLDNLCFYVITQSCTRRGWNVRRFDSALADFFISCE